MSDAIPLDRYAIHAIRYLLVKRREELGLWQWEVAERMGRHQTVVSNLETGVAGNPRISQLAEWAAALDYNAEITFVEASRD